MWFTSDKSQLKGENKKRRELILETIKEKNIIDEQAGNNRYLVITKDAVLIGSTGITSGTWFGRKVKSYPIESITSVDVQKGIITGHFEITGAGMGGTSKPDKSLFSRDENLIFFPASDFKRWQDLVKTIRNLITKTNGTSRITESIPDQIRKLSELYKEGILTKEEFEKKKKKLLSEI